jgi:acyl-CoA thioester hydrolase
MTDSNVAGNGTYSYEIPVQFRDLDPRRHVNHVVYGAYCEQAKAGLFEDVLGLSLTDASTVVRTLEIDYERPIESGAHVLVEISVANLGRTSYTLSYDLRVDGERVASARTVSVNLADGTPTPLPNTWRERLAPLEAG